jgi:predicted alpha/beta hydrolase family esterase
VTTRVLLLPGLYDSGPEHWQSHWERALPGLRRVRQRDWETPDRQEWVETLDRAVAEAGPDVVLAGHSTSCALVAFWARRPGRRVRGALLVGPSDTEAPSYPSGPTGWAPMPLDRLPFPSIVVASENDEYVTLERAAQFASAWGGRLVNIGALGHINSASGLGDWPRGRALLDELLTRCPT